MIRNAFKWAIFAVAIVSAALPATAQDKQLLAGVGTANISPWMGLDIAGSMRHNTVKYVHDELHVRSMVIDDGASIIAFAIVDSCMAPREIFDAAKTMIHEAHGIPIAHMLMSATHTHSAPCSTPVFQNKPDPEYQQFLTKRIADAVAQALQNRRTARIGWGKVAAPEHVFNRRWYLKDGEMFANPFGSKGDGVKMNPPRGSDILVEPAGPTDPDVNFVAIETTDGAPLGLLANYSLHYVGGVGGGHASGDYFAVFADRIKEALDPGTNDPPYVAMMTNGTSGDINNINFREGSPSRKPYEQMNIVANDVADAVLEAYGDIEWQEWAPVRGAAATLELGVRKPTDEDVAQAKAILAETDGPLTQTPQIYAWETVRLAEYPDTVEMIVQAIGIGDLTIAAIPCEVFVEIGLELKEKGPTPHTFTIELANGYNGYLPTPKHHDLGGYETWRARSSYLEVQASEKIVDTLLPLMQGLH